VSVKSRERGGGAQFFRLARQRRHDPIFSNPTLPLKGICMLTDQSSITTPSRRHALLTGAGAVAAVAAAAITSMPSAQAATPRAAGLTPTFGGRTVTSADGTHIFFRDSGGNGQPVVFSHGWPLSGAVWEAQMLFLGQLGYRVIAVDRRGHGFSGTTWEGNDMDHYGDDLATVIDSLNLNHTVLIGHSTGGGEVARYIGRHGNKRLAKVILIAAVTPYMLQTPIHPVGAPKEVFDGLRAGVVGVRSQFYMDLAMPFFGFNRPGAKVLQGLINDFYRIGMQSDIKASFDCIKAFSETDMRADLQKIAVPTLLLHGDDDQIVPIDISSKEAVKLIKGATLKVYPGQPHGMAMTIPATINADILAFLKS
jgi:non-heme chloroperoxidase